MNRITREAQLRARHLRNIHRIHRRRSNGRWMRFDAAKELDESLTAAANEKDYRSIC